jgi:hypothetical protein
MAGPALEPRLFEELRPAPDAGLASSALNTSNKATQQLEQFQERFGPDVLRDPDGEALPRLSQLSLLVQIRRIPRDSPQRTATFPR